MAFALDKKDGGRPGGKDRGRRFRLGRRRASLKPGRQDIRCICPACGLSVPHEQGVQCFKLRCPQCGSAMARRFSDKS